MRPTDALPPDLQSLNWASRLKPQLMSCMAQTIESTREKDETVVALDDAEVQADEAQDEFSGVCESCANVCFICFDFPTSNAITGLSYCTHAPRTLT